MNKKSNTPYKLYFMVFSVALMNLLISMDMTMINLAINDIARDFNICVFESELVITVYYLSSAISFIIFGRLADHFGYKRIFLIGIALFTIASLIASTSLNFDMLVISRVLQGVGFGATLSLSSLLILAHSPADKKGLVSGLMVTISSLGQLLGPTVGGYIVDYWGWCWTFLINVPVGIISFYGCYKFIHNKREEPIDVFDVKETVMFLFSAGPLISVLVLYSDLFLSQSFILIFGGLCVIICNTIKYGSFRVPLINNDLIKNKDFISICKIRFFYMNFIGSWLYFTPIYLQKTLNYSVSDSGYILFTMSLVVASSSLFIGKMIDKFGYKYLLILSIIAVQFTSLFMLIILNCHSSLFYLIAACISIGFAIAFQGSASVIGISQVVKANQGGAAMGIFYTAALVGSALGVSVGSSLVESLGTQSIETSLSITFIIFSLFVLLSIPSALRLKYIKTG